jgi:hypothetical protein
MKKGSQKKNQLKHHDSVKPFSPANTSLPIAGLDWGYLVKVGASHQGKWGILQIRKRLELIYIDSTTMSRNNSTCSLGLVVCRACLKHNVASASSECSSKETHIYMTCAGG